MAADAGACAEVMFAAFADERGEIVGIGGDVRVATVHDIEMCDDLCRRVHGHDRHGELCNWIDAGMAQVVERGGEITGYATGCGYFSHAVGDTDEDVIALLAGAELIVGLGVLVPSRNTRLMAWCLDSGLQLVQQSTLMTIGLYNEPRGSWLPSVGY
jgi:hypothetical protein